VLAGTGCLGWMASQHDPAGGLTLYDVGTDEVVRLKRDVGLVCDEALRELIREGLSGDVGFACDPTELGTIVGRVCPRALVVECGTPRSWKCEDVLGALGVLESVPEILVCWRPSVAGARELFHFTSRTLRLRVVVPAYEDPRPAVRGLVEGAPPGAESVTRLGAVPKHV
jgi:hypothetical protein